MKIAGGINIKDAERFLQWRMKEKRKKKHEIVEINLELESTDDVVPSYDMITEAASTHQVKFTTQEENNQPWKQREKQFQDNSRTTKVEESQIKKGVVNCQSKLYPSLVKNLNSTTTPFNSTAKLTLDDQTQSEKPFKELVLQHLRMRVQLSKQEEKVQELKTNKSQGEFESKAFVNKLKKCLGVSMEDIEKKKEKKVQLLPRRMTRTMLRNVVSVQSEHDSEADIESSLDIIQQAKYRLKYPEIIERIEELTEKVSSLIRLRKKTVNVPDHPRIVKGTPLYPQMILYLKRQLQRRQVVSLD